jgi:hypothetical protein
MFPSENQIKQRQTKIDVIARDNHHEPQIRLNQALARHSITPLNFPRDLDLLPASKEELTRSLVNIC